LFVLKANKHGVVWRPLDILQNRASTKNGWPGRDTGHRLKGVMVDGATYTVAHDVRGRMTTALNLDLT